MSQPINIFILILSFFGALNCETPTTDEIVNKLTVQVFYETLCPDSRYFLNEQLYPSLMEKGRLAYTNLKLIPYGKADHLINEKTNETTVQCQHGHRECELNALHACVIEHLDLVDAINVTNCLIKDFYKSDLTKCATSFGVNVEAVEKCYASKSVADLLQEHGKETKTIQLTYVPSVEFDNSKKYSRTEQYRFVSQFDAFFCKKYFEKFNTSLKDCEDVKASDEDSDEDDD